MHQIYPDIFHSLVQRINSTNEEDLKFIGLGNPCSSILIIGKESAIDRTSTRGKGCFEMEYLHNAKQWQNNIDNQISSHQIPNWLESPISEEYYNPLFPYNGQKNIKAFRDEDGSVINGGTSSTWQSYQKLIDRIFDLPSPSNINFFERAFITELSGKSRSYSGHYSQETKESINIRCNNLLNDPFFRSFKVIIAGCGHYVRDYKINLPSVFDQKYIGIKEDETGWICVHEKDGRLLLHTRHLSMCSDDMIDKIAAKVRDFLITPLLKYCLYYDGSNESMKNSLMGLYEHHWLYDSLYTRDNEHLVDVQEMINSGVEEKWIDSFEIPRTLVGVFYNRYCHWMGGWDKLEFKEWFEKVRRKQVE